jgi:hypothetical protein
MSMQHGPPFRRTLYGSILVLIKHQEAPYSGASLLNTIDFRITYFNQPILSVKLTTNRSHVVTKAILHKIVLHVLLMQSLKALRVHTL